MYEELMKKIKEIKSDIIYKLYLYKNNSYFNLFFYDIIDMLDNKNDTIFKCYELINRNYDSYQIIYKTLTDICININVEEKIYTNYINSLFYQLTHLDANNIIKNVALNNKLDNLLIKSYCSIVKVSYEKYIKKQYEMYISSGVINCIDASNDNVSFVYNDEKINDVIVLKNIYTMKDVKILAQICSNIRLKGIDNIIVAIEYCIRIIDYQDDLLINSLKT